MSDVHFPSPFPRLVTTGLIWMIGAFSTPAESASTLGLPSWLALRAVEGLDDGRERHSADWDALGTESTVLPGGGTGAAAEGGLSPGRPGLPVVKDPQPAMPAVLPAIPAASPKRHGSEPHGEGGALTTIVPSGTNGAREMRLQMREYGSRFGARHGDPRGGAKASPRLLRDAGGEGRWLDADERSTFREALRERHHRPRH